MRAQSVRHLRLCNPMDSSQPDSSVQGILQARILEWVAISSSRGSSPARDQTLVSCISALSGTLPLCYLGIPRITWGAVKTSGVQASPRATQAEILGWGRALVVCKAPWAIVLCPRMTATVERADKSALGSIGWLSWVGSQEWFL